MIRDTDETPSSTFGTAGSANAGRATKIPWFLIFWIFLISAVAYIDRINLSIPGQAIAKDFRLTDIQLGWVFSAFVLG